MRAKILNASAGSGKTYQLAYKYVKDVVERPHLYRHILAVTFTNKATEEMKSRILNEINNLASGANSSYIVNLCSELKLDELTIRKRAKEALTKILHDYSRFTILTIDTFFQRIMRAFIKELGIELNYNIELETSSILTRSADRIIDEITTNEELYAWLLAFVQERIDDGKKWDVREGILSLGNELFKEKNKETLIAVKSKEELNKIISRSIAESRSSKEQMQQLAVSAVDIIDEAYLTIDDFPYKKTGFINYFYTIAAGKFDGYKQRVIGALDNIDAWGKKGSKSLDMAPQLQPLLRQMCGLYDANYKFWNTTDLIRENYRSFALLADLYLKVQQMCDKENLMLLSETKHLLSEFIGTNDAPFIYEKVGNRFEHFMIDEFQDTSVKEWENFLPLLQNAMSQSDQTSVFIVGDIKQSIYRWRGGDWKILHSTAQNALGSDETVVVNLKDNFRSLPAIVNFNNNMIDGVVKIDNLALNSMLEEAVRGESLKNEHQIRLHDMLSQAYSEHQQTPRKDSDRAGYINISTYVDEPPIIERIKEILDKGFKPEDIMILVRGKLDGGKVAATLLDFKRTNSDPRYHFDVMTQEALVIGNAPICTFIISAMHLALNSDHSLNRAIYNHYLGGRKFNAQLNSQEVEFFRSIRLLSPEEAFERIVMVNNLKADKSQIAYLQAIHEQIINFCANRVADISLFLKWWDEQGHKKSISVKQSHTTIEVTTIHKAKGLEKKVILIPYCSWQLEPKSAGSISNIVWADAEDGDERGVGRFPVKYKKSMADSMFSSDYYQEMVYSHVDNINLLYVALTRAIESLHVFVPQGSKNSVGKLMLNVLDVDGGKVTLGTTEGRYSTENGCDRFEFGEFGAPATSSNSNTKATGYILDDYPTTKTDMELRLPSRRYFEDSTNVELSPRNYGILMHKVFENAMTLDDIQVKIESMITNGEMSKESAVTLQSMIDKAFLAPLVRSWFSSQWHTIRKESNIIIPQSLWTRRPDRVMISDDKVVVVDYKFGEDKSKKHHQQIADYIYLLSQIGYKNIDGYLWYVKLGEIVKV